MVCFFVWSKDIVTVFVTSDFTTLIKVSGRIYLIEETNKGANRCSMKSITRVGTVAHPTSIGCIRPTLIELLAKSQIYHYYSYHMVLSDYKGIKKINQFISKIFIFLFAIIFIFISLCDNFFLYFFCKCVLCNIYIYVNSIVSIY